MEALHELDDRMRDEVVRQYGRGAVVARDSAKIASFLAGSELHLLMISRGI